MLDECMLGCVFRLRKRCLVCGATADVLQDGIRMVTLELLRKEISDLSGLWTLRFCLSKYRHLANKVPNSNVLTNFLDP